MDESNRLIGLDGLRGIAALSVVLFHAIMAQTGSSQGNAYLAVDFFFLLSGYVMARTYEARLGCGLSPSGFLRVRLRRLWPTMALGGLFGLAPLYGSAGETGPTGFAAIAMANLLLIPIFTGRLAFPLNPPSWSIFSELFANLAHAIVLRRLPARWLLAICAAMVPMLAAIGAGYGLDVGSHSSTFVFGFARVSFSYTLGIALWRMWQDQPKLSVSSTFAFIAMPVLFVGTMPIEGTSWLTDLLFIVCLAPMILAGGLAFKGDSRLARVGGAISFPLYAVHGPIIEWGRQAGLPTVLSVALCLMVACLVAYPGQALGRRLRCWRRDTAPG
jgi:peptidoglycan/LPS O-acetylase OafA/YrhL